MTFDPQPTGLGRRKRVRVRLRPNLAFSLQQEDGRSWYVVKDPVTLAYFRMDEGQRFVAGLLDGTRTLEEVRTAYEEAFRPERLPLEELEAFAAQLLDGGLAEVDSPLAAGLLCERARKHRREALLSRFLNILYVKVPLCDPDAALGRASAWLRPFFGAAGVLAGLAAVLAAAGLVDTHWGDFVGRLPTYREFFRPQTLLYLWLALGAAKVLHELGHGIVCKLQGGAVPEMGVLFLVFCPTLYCDASDSWVLPGRWRRMAVAAAGVYVDLLVAAAATFVWWLTRPDSLAHNLAFGLMAVCGLGTLAWNANPLMRFDGYYLLSDWLGVPNLAERSARFLQAAALRWLGADVAAEALPARGRLLFAAYAVASYVYRAGVAAAVAWSLYAVLRPYRLGAVGAALGLTTLCATLGQPVYRLLRSFAARGRLPDFRPGRLSLALGGAAFAAVTLLAVPLPVPVEGQAVILVEPDRVARLVVPETGGFVSEVRARDGQAVRAGEVVAVLTNPRLEIRARVNEADQALRSEQRSALAARLADGGPGAEEAGDDIGRAQSELQALAREHRLLTEQRERLTVRAPCDGVVMGLRPQELQGRWLDKGAEVCRVGDPRALRAVLVIDPAEHRLIAGARTAWVLVHGRGGSCLPGTVTDVAQVGARSVPPQLSCHAGGEVATEQDPVTHAEKPRDQSYLVSVRLQGADATVQPGVLGRVRIEAPPQTGWWRLQRYVVKTFGWNL